MSFKPMTTVELIDLPIGGKRPFRSSEKVRNVARAIFVAFANPIEQTNRHCDVRDDVIDAVDYAKNYGKRNKEVDHQNFPPTLSIDFRSNDSLGWNSFLIDHTGKALSTTLEITPSDSRGTTRLKVDLDRRIRPQSECERSYWRQVSFSVQGVPRQAK